MGSSNCNRWAMHCVGRKYDEAVPSTTAGNEEVDHERILGQTLDHEVEMNHLQSGAKSGPNPACRELLPRIVETIKKGRININRKRQKIRNKHNKELAKENEQRSNSKSADPTPEPCYPDSRERGHVELLENLPANGMYDKIQDLQQKSQVYKSQSGIRSSMRRFKQFIRSLTAAKGVVEIKLDKQRDSTTTVKRRFSVLNKADKKSLRIQLSIWFPCLFPRPTFKILQEAIVRITTGICRDLCRMEVIGMNQQISQTKAQRTLFRKEQKRERYSTKPSIYFVSNIVPECQKRVSSITINFFKGGSTTSKENCSRVIEMGSKVNKTTECDCIIKPLPTVDDVTQRNRVLTYPTDEKSVAQTNNRRHSDINYCAPEPSFWLEIQHHRVPEWFRSMIRNKAVIYILPAESKNDKGTSSETKHLMFQRRILFSGFHFGGELSSVNEHNLFSVLEQESTAQSDPAFTHFKAPCSTPRMLQTTHVHSSEVNIHGHNKIVSVQDEDAPGDFQAEACVTESSSQTYNTYSVLHNNLRGVYCRRSQNTATVDCGRENCAHLSLENRRKQIRKHIHSCLEQQLASEADESHKQYVDMKTCHPKDSQLASTERYNSCHVINNSNLSQSNGGEISSLSSKITSKKMTGGQYDTMRRPKTDNILASISFMGSAICNVDTNLNKNIDALNAHLCGGNTKQTMVTHHCSVEGSENLKREDIRRNQQQQRREILGKLRNGRSTANDNVSVLDAPGAYKTRDCQMNAQYRECDICYKEQAIEESSNTHPKKYEGNKVKKVRFNGTKRQDEKIPDNMDKSNSSVHEVQEVFDDGLKVVIDNVTESKQCNTVTCTVGTNLLSNSQGGTACARETDDMNETVPPKGALTSFDKPSYQCICGHDKKCTNDSNLYFKKDVLADKLNIVVEKSRCKMKVGNQDKLSESSSISRAQNCNAKNCITKRECEKSWPFCGYCACRDKPRGKRLKHYLSRHEGPKTFDAEMRIALGVTSRESLTNFVKEQWRSCCHTSHDDNPKPLSMTDFSQNKQCLCEQNATFLESDPSPFDLSKDEHSNSYSKIKSSFNPQEVVSDNGMKSLSLQREPSYETMCTERRENYRKLSRILTNYYESASEDLGDAHSISSARSLQLSEAELTKSQVGIKTSASLEKNPLELKYKIPNNSPVSSTSTELTTSTTINHIYPQSNLDRSRETAFGESAVNSVARTARPGKYPTSSSSDNKAELKSQNSPQVTLTETKHRNTTKNKQTQTSTASVFQMKSSAIHDLITPKLNLPNEESGWLMESMTSRTTVGPQQPSEFYYTFLALDKLVAQYCDLACAERHSFRKLNKNTYRKSTLKIESAITCSLYKQVGDIRSGNANPCASRDAKCCQTARGEGMSELAQNCSVNNGQDSPPMTSYNQHFTQKKVTTPQTKKSASKSKQPKLDPVPEALSPDNAREKQSLAREFEDKYKSPNGHFSQSQTEAFPPSPDRNSFQSPAINTLLSPRESISLSPVKNIPPSPRGNIPKIRNDFISKSPTRKAQAVRTGNTQKPLDINVTTQSNENIQQFQTEYVSRFQPWNVLNSTIPSPDLKGVQAVRTGNTQKPLDTNVTTQSNENIQQFQTEYVSRFQPWNVSNATIPSADPKGTTETVRFTDQRPETHLVKEFTDTGLTFPSRLSLMSQYSNKQQPLLGDTSTDDSTTSQTSSQPLKRPDFKSFNYYTEQVKKSPAPVVGNETINRLSFHNEDSITSMGKLAIDAKDSYKVPALDEDYSTKHVSPNASTLQKNYHSETKLRTCKNDELLKNWSIVNSSPEQKFVFTPSDSEAQHRTDEYYQLERREILNRATRLSNFESVLAANALLQSTERSCVSTKRNTDSTERSCVSTKRNTDSTERSCVSTKRNTDSTERSCVSTKRNTDSTERSCVCSKRDTDSTACQEYQHKDNTVQCQTSYQMSATGTMCENMRDCLNKTAVPTSCCGRQSTNSQAKSKYEMELRIGAERQYEAALSNETQRKYGTHFSVDATSVMPAGITFTQSDVYKGHDRCIRNMSHSPHEPNIGGFGFVEVDNRLLDPSKRYHDISILQDSCKQDPEIQTRTVVNPESCKASLEEKYDSYAADRINSLPTRQSTEKCTQVQNVVHPTAELRLEKPCRLDASSKPKSTSSGIDVCIQTCVCISKPNGTCMCGYLSIKDKWEPTQITTNITSNDTAKPSCEIKGTNISDQISKNVEKREKEANICCPQNKCDDHCSNYLAQENRWESSPSKIKYRNKKCQIRDNAAAKSGLTLPATCQCQQAQGSARNCISPVTIKCIHECFDSHKINNQFTLRTEAAPCKNCNKLFENITKQFETPNLSSEVTTNSSDDNECKVCKGNNFKDFEQNTSNTFSTRCNAQMRFDWKPRGGKIQESRERRDCKSDQDSSRVNAAEITQKNSSDESSHVKGKRPIAQIQCKSRHSRNASQCLICRNNAHTLRQQLMEQISGIIKNSKLLQEQATQLRKKCKRLDQQQWSSVDWGGHDTQDHCQCNESNLTPDCENNNQNPGNPSDKNANANLACDNVLHLDSNLQGVLPTSNVSSLAASTGSYKHAHDKLYECKQQRNTAPTLDKLSQEIHTKTYKFVSDKNADTGTLFSSKNERVASSCYDEKQKIHSTDCECSQQNQHNHGHFYDRKCPCPLWVESDTNQSWNARPVAHANGTEVDSKLQRHEHFPTKHYFFNDPSEEAYQYMRAHFPAVSTRSQHEECKNVGVGTREDVRNGSNLLIEGDLKLMETQPRVGLSMKCDITTSSATGIKQHFEEHDLLGAKLTKSLPLLKRAWINSAKSEPRIRDWNDTYEATLAPCGALNSSHTYNTQHLGRSNEQDYKYVQSGIPNAANSFVHENNKSLSLIPEYKTDAVFLPGKNNWQQAYKGDSFNQRTMPIKSAKDSTSDINTGFHKTHAPHNYFTKDLTALSEDCNGIPSVGDLHKVALSTGMLVSFPSGQNTRHKNVTPSANKRCIVSTPRQDSSQSCSHYNSSAVGHLLKATNISETAVHESPIRSYLYINKELQTPDVCAKNLRNCRLRQNRYSIPALDTFEPKTEYLGYGTTRIKPQEFSLCESMSETSLISVEAVLNAVNNINVPRFVSCPLTSADDIDPKGLQTEVETFCDEDRQPLNQISAVVGSDILQQQNGSKFHPRNKKGLVDNSTADTAMSRESGTREKSEHEVRNKHRILPAIKLGMRQTCKLSAVDSQDSSHGIEDLPLDSSSTEAAHLKRNRTGIKQLKDPTITCSRDRNTECKNIILDPLVHKRVLFARPLPLPMSDRRSAIHQNAGVNQPKIRTAEHRAPTNCSSVITTEYARLSILQSHVDSVKPKLKCEDTGQITLGQDLNKFEVNNIVAETIDNPGHGEFLLCRNSPENWKRENGFSDTAKFHARAPLSSSKKTLSDSDNLISSACFGIHPSKQNSTTDPYHIDGLDSHSGTAAEPSQNENSLSDEAVLAENIPKEVDMPINWISLDNEIKTDIGHQWSPCLFGCAEITSANDNSVIIEGTYVKQFPSGAIFNEIVAPENNSDELRWQQRKVVPFRLMLSKDKAHGDSNHVIGTYSRQLLTGGDFFTWNLVADSVP